MYYRYVKISDDQIQWKRKIYHIVGTVLNSNWKIVERQHRHHLHTYTWLLTFWLDLRTLVKTGSVKLVLLAKMTNLLYVYFRIITTKEKNTTERHFNVKSTTKKNKTHPSQSISPLCCVLSGEVTYTNLIVFGLTRSALEVSTLTITPSIRLYCGYANYSKCRYVTLDIQFCV
jgi:hypothetical protein